MRQRQKIFVITEENGARGRNRTTDTAILSRMLYQLSYPGARGFGVPKPSRPPLQARSLQAARLSGPLVLSLGIEPRTSSLPMKCSTPEL